MFGDFVGPGWDPEVGLVGEPQETYIAHATWIELKPGEEANEEFNRYFNPTVAAVVAADGVIATQLGASELCRTGRTIGVWRGRMDMLRYVASAEHVAAIAAMDSFALDAETTHWEIDATDLPLTFEAAREELAN